MEDKEWINRARTYRECFDNLDLPSDPFKLNQCTTIINCKRFLDNHFKTLELGENTPSFKPCLGRLKEFKNKI